jgi:hypothetical protein
MVEIKTALSRLLRSHHISTYTLRSLWSLRASPHASLRSARRVRAGRYRLLHRLDFIRFPIIGTAKNNDIHIKATS